LIDQIERHLLQRNVSKAGKNVRHTDLYAR
jgi:hypothetical protein